MLLLLVWLSYKAVRMGLYGRTIYQNGMALVQMSNNGSDALLADMAIVEERLDRVSAAMDGLAREARPFAPVLNRLDWVPVYGPTVAAVPELLLVGQEMLDLAQEGVAFAVPVLADVEEPVQRAGLVSGVMSALPAAQETFNAMATHAERAAAALSTVPAAELHPRVVDELTLAGEGLVVLPSLLRMAPLLPDLLGMDEPRTYLLLVQNSDELRATGGFVTALARVELENAQLAGLDFADSSRVMRKDVEYGRAPEPMQRYMGIELMVLRDANWSPDFPTTAQAMRSLYAQETGIFVDGIVTVDLHAVEKIMAGLGALRLEDLDEPLTSANIVDRIKQFWTQPLETGDTIESAGLGGWWGQRKNFMPLLAEAALQRVQNGNIDHAAMAQSTLAALNARSIQVWMDNEMAQAEMRALGWDGGLHPEEASDFIAWVDSNLGYNKADAVLERSLLYRVEWPDDAGHPGLATITMTYRHGTPVPGHECDNTPRYGTSYDDMTLRCYFNYVRLYVPKGSELIRAEGVDADSVGTQRGEKGLQVFSGYFILEPGDENRVSFHYRLPPTLTPDQYALLIQRQSGTEALPVVTEIDGERREATLAEGWMRIE